MVEVKDLLLIPMEAWRTRSRIPDMAQLEKNFDRRPDPDALLALTDKEAGGKLRVFLGAAPGVGKTYPCWRRRGL